ncbi:hypothetical protein C3L33_10687, partial [Rhododendron williamsianum]
AWIGEVKRVTKETNVAVRINLDGSGIADSSIGIPFLDHMFDQLASHGLFDIHVKAIGDFHIDDHHTNEDAALAIGTALLHGLGDRKGLNRFGDFSAPLDEALIHVSLVCYHTCGFYCALLSAKNAHICSLQVVTNKLNAETLSRTRWSDPVCRVWDIRSKKQVHALSGHENTVCSVFTRPTVRYLLCSGNDVSKEMAWSPTEI